VDHHFLFCRAVQDGRKGVRRQFEESNNLVKYIGYAFNKELEGFDSRHKCPHIDIPKKRILDSNTSIALILGQPQQRLNRANADGMLII
jgi:hypothetical protein